MTFFPCHTFDKFDFTIEHIMAALVIRLMALMPVNEKVEKTRLRFHIFKFKPPCRPTFKDLRTPTTQGPVKQGLEKLLQKECGLSA